MQKNPNRVTMFGASQSGRNSTHAFHYVLSVAVHSHPHFELGRRRGGIGGATYVVSQDIITYPTLIHTAVLVALQMHQRILAQALGCRALYGGEDVS